MKTSQIIRRWRNAVLLSIFSFFSVMQGQSQNLPQFRSLQLSYGLTGFPGEIVRGSHERYLTDKINIVFAASYEQGSKSGLRFSSIGMEVLTRYYSDLGLMTNHRFQFHIAAGPVLELNQERSIYKGMSIGERINYGIAGQWGAEWSATQDISLILNLCQKVFLVKKLGRDSFDVSAGIKLKFF